MVSALLVCFLCGISLDSGVLFSLLGGISSGTFPWLWNGNCIIWFPMAQQMIPLVIRLIYRLKASSHYFLGSAI